MSTSESVIEKCPQTKVSRNNGEVLADFRLCQLLKLHCSMTYTSGTIYLLE